MRTTFPPFEGERGMRYATPGVPIPHVVVERTEPVPAKAGMRGTIP